MSDARPTDPQARLALLVAENEVEVDRSVRPDYWNLVGAVAAKLGVDDYDRTDGKAALDRLESASTSATSARSSSSKASASSSTSSSTSAADSGSGSGSDSGSGSGSSK